MILRTLFAGLLCSGLAFGQITTSGHEVDSGPLTNSSSLGQVVWSGAVQVLGASDLQVLFASAEFASEEDRLILSSAADGKRQSFSPKMLKYWENHSAWFNGDRVDLSIYLSPGSTGRVVVERSYSHRPAAYVDTICDGTDNRFVTTDPRCCRMVGSAGNCSGPGACGTTGFLISDRSVILGTGHSSGWFWIGQFNVPLSTNTGAIQHPSPSDQYPVDRTTMRVSNNNNSGNDWVAARLHPNANGERASQRQNAWYTPANTISAVGATVRVPGYGIDDAPLSSHAATQVAFGILTGSDTPSSQIWHDVDTTPGNSGSPIVDATTQQVLGIHKGGCDGNLANRATSILNPDLQDAITYLNGCTLVDLNVNPDRTLTCSPARFALNPVGNVWNGVCVSSSSDWDLEMDGVAALGNGNDFLLLDPRTSSGRPRVGESSRFQGSDDATLIHRTATPIPVNTVQASTWSTDEFFRLNEITVNSSGSFTISIHGDSSLTWGLYRQLGQGWQSQYDGVVAADLVANGPRTGVHLDSGTYCLMIQRLGGAGPITDSQVVVSVYSYSPALELDLATPTKNWSDCRALDIDPVQGRWNLVSHSGPLDSAIAMGSAYSNAPGTSFDFIVADGHHGVVSPDTGTLYGPSGGQGNIALHQTGTIVQPGAPSSSTIPAGWTARLVEVHVTSPGNYRFAVSGTPGLFWRVFGPQSTSRWLDRGDTDFDGTVNQNPVNAVLPQGHYAVVVYRPGGTRNSEQPFQVHVCPPAAPAPPLSPSQTLSLGAACGEFEASPGLGFTGVGVSGPSDFELTMGPTLSNGPGSQCEFVLSNGRLGAPSPTRGEVIRHGTAGTATIQQALTTTLTLGRPLRETMAAGDVLRVIEFEVVTSGNFDFGTLGPASLDWALFDAGSSAGWRSRADAMATGSVNDASQTLALRAGFYAVVLTRNGGPGSSALVDLSVTAVTPARMDLHSVLPGSLTAGGGASPIIALGQAFTAGSQIELDGLPLATTFISSIELSATLPATATDLPGSLSIRVRDGATLSSLQVVAVHEALPVIASLSPSQAAAGGGGQNIQVQGSGFSAQSVVKWAGSPLVTTFVSSSLLTVAAGAPEFSAAGSFDLVVENPNPGGGASAAVPFLVTPPQPTLTSLDRGGVPAGSYLTTIALTGADFVPHSVVLVDGTSVPTFFQNENLLHADLGSEWFVNPGSLAVQVFNLDGGLSMALGLQVEEPQITRLTPDLLPLLTATSTPVVLGISGARFVPGSRVYAGSRPLTTAFLDQANLTFVLPPDLVAAQRRGGIAITVENTRPASSNTAALVMGGGSNQGTLRRQPLAPAPGEGFAYRFEGGRPASPLTVIVDLVPSAPVHPFPNAAWDFVLDVRPFVVGDPTWLVAFDGIGIYGLPQPVAFDAAGQFTVGGIVQPNPPLDASLTIQGLYLDPTHPAGFRLNWSRFADEL